MRTCNNDRHGMAGSLDRFDTKLADRPGKMPMPERLSEAQRRAMPMLNTWLVEHPGSSFAEIAAGLGWPRQTVCHYLQHCRFPFTGSWADKRFYAYGQLPADA